MSRNARKIFRMAKTLNEVKSVLDLVNDIKIEKLIKIMEVMSRIGFGFFWFFENLSVLSNLKLLNFDVKNMNKMAYLGWSIGLLLGVIKNIIEIYKLYQKRSDNSKNNFYIYLIHKILEIIGRIGDMIISSNGVDLPKILFGKNFNEGILAIGGLTSSIIAVYLIFVKNYVNLK